MDEKLIKKSRFYAWCVVATGFFTFFMIYGSALNCVGLFMAPMSESLGVDRAVTSSFSTVQLLTMIPVGIILGRIIDKTDLKWVMAICCACVGGGYIIYGTVTNIAVLYGASAIIGIGLAGSIQIPVAVFINGWFIKKKGVAMGLTMVGSGVGGTILSQIIARIIAGQSWQQAYIMLGVATIVITVPLVLLFITKDPHSRGLLKYGEEEEEKLVGEAGQNKNLARESRSVGDIVRTPEFWFLFVGLTLLTLPMGAIKGHMIAYMTDLGYSVQTATNILTLSVIAVIPGKPVTGIIFDKCGSKVATLVCGLCMTIGVFLFAGISAAFLFAILFGIIYGFGSAFSSVGAALCLKDVARTDNNFATVLSIIMIGSGIAGAFGTTIVGAIHDQTGSYTMAFMVSGVVIAIGYVLTFIAMGISKRKQAGAYTKQVETKEILVEGMEA